MIIKRFSATQILNTNGVAGFTRGRKYDTDFDRLGRMKTSQRELNQVGGINSELRKLRQELNDAKLGKQTSGDNSND